MCGWSLGGRSRRGVGFAFVPALAAAAVVVLAVDVAAAAAAAFVAAVVAVVFFAAAAAAAAVVAVVVFAAAAVAVVVAVVAVVAVVGIVLLEFVVGSDYFRRREKFARTKMKLGVAAAVVEDLGVVRHLWGPFFSSSWSYWSLPPRPAPIPSVL